MLITIYIDESGTHAGSPIMVLGGRVAKLGQWIDFDRKWWRLLKRSGVEYVHGKEFRARRGQFAGWSDSDCNAFLSKAQKIIDKHTLCGFAVTMTHEDYNEVYRTLERPRKVKVDGKYGLCFRIALLQIPRLLRRSIPSHDLNVNFVLESGDRGSGDALVIRDDAKKNAPAELADMLGVLAYGDKKKLPGLQAADLIAFSAFQEEQAQQVDLTPVSKDFTLGDARRVTNIGAPVAKFEITPSVMKEVVRNGIADIEERKRFWLDSRTHPTHRDDPALEV